MRNEELIITMRNTAVQPGGGQAVDVDFCTAGGRSGYSRWGNIFFSTADARSLSLFYFGPSKAVLTVKHDIDT